jgi:hypothetical protein
MYRERWRYGNHGQTGEPKLKLDFADYAETE